MANEKTVKVKYVGTAEVANHEVGLATGDGDVIEPGATYELPEELAHRLLLSNADWQLTSGAKATEELREKARTAAEVENKAIASTAVENKAGDTPGATEEE